MNITALKNIKIGIAVPCRDQVHSLFTYSLVKLIQYQCSSGIPTKLYMMSGTLIADQRHKLANECIRDNCTHILWLDSDMMFPQNLATKLLQHNLPVVACNYSTRSEPRKSVAYEKYGDWQNWLNSKNQTESITQVEAVGMGCMLTSIDAIKGLEDPYFEILYDNTLKEWIGEDFYFCQKLIKAGNKIFIDNKLSMNILHLGVTAYQNQTL